MKHSTLAAIVVGGLGVFLAGCGGPDRSDNPASPSSSHLESPTPTLSISAPVGVLKVDHSFTIFGIAVHHDGTAAVPITRWYSDNPAVARVEADGKVTGVANGFAEIIGEHDGARASARLRVVPDYDGNWYGEYQTTSCHESDDFAGFCAQFPVGAILPVSLQLTQPLATVEGAFSLGGLSAPIHGAIDASGRLAFGETSWASDALTVRIGGWALDLAENEELQGVFRTQWTSAAAEGEGGFDGQLRLVTRVTGTSRLAARNAARSWHGAIRAAGER